MLLEELSGNNSDDSIETVFLHPAGPVGPITTVPIPIEVQTILLSDFLFGVVLSFIESPLQARQRELWVRGRQSHAIRCKSAMEEAMVAEASRALGKLRSKTAQAADMSSSII